MKIGAEAVEVQHIQRSQARKRKDHPGRPDRSGRAGDPIPALHELEAVSKSYDSGQPPNG